MQVVVTGMGAITGVGAGVDVLAGALATKRSGVRPFPASPNPDSDTAHACYIDDVPATVPARADHFLHAAVTEAVESAQLRLPLARLPIFLGSAHGNLDVWCRMRRGGRTDGPALWNLGQGLWPSLAEQYSVTTTATACTASAVALGQALDCLRRGDAPVALVAGAEGLTTFLFNGFDSLRSLAKGMCRPFDRHRTGLVLGEGAAALVVETLAHARARGVEPLAEVAGFGLAADGFQLTAPDPSGAGASAALREALRDAGMNGLPDSVNAHGTGTRLSDRAECVALQRVFGDDMRRIPVTSTKPVTGHMCGAAGAVEIVASILSLRGDLVPPILNFEQPDREHAGFDFVHGSPRREKQNTVISLNSAFGGSNTAVVLKKAMPL